VFSFVIMPIVMTIVFVMPVVMIIAVFTISLGVLMVVGVCGRG
jgi:hypothetical protein